MQIETIIEKPRRCGKRKPGGLYLRAEGTPAACCRLPIPLDVCPICGQGVKPARGWTWIEAGGLLLDQPCKLDEPCRACALNPSNEGPPLVGKSGLVWVGEKFYRTPAEFIDEAREQGISRRLPALPHGWKLGTYVFLAHRFAIGGKGRGIFALFRPTRVEYVVKGEETETELEALVKRDITPVRVIGVSGYEFPTLDDDEEL